CLLITQGLYGFSLFTVNSRANSENHKYFQDRNLIKIAGNKEQISLFLMEAHLAVGRQSNFPALIYGNSNLNVVKYVSNSIDSLLLHEHHTFLGVELIHAHGLSYFVVSNWS